MTPLTLGIVGAGHIANRHADAFEPLRAAGELVVAGVADHAPAAANALATRLDCAAFDNCAAMLERVAPDVVLIATPPVAHAPDVVLCLQRAVHVLCEKPLAIDLRGLADIRAALRASPARLAMASKYRHAPDVTDAHRLVAGGAIGRLQSLEISFAREVDMSGRWNSHAPVSGGGVLMDNGPHAADLARLFAGPVREVKAARGAPGRLPVEDTVHLLLRSGGGVVTHGHLSWSVSSPGDTFLVARGSEGTIEVGWNGSRLTRLDRAEPFGKGFDGIEAMHRQMRNFLAGLRGGELLTTAEDDAIDNVRVVTAAYAALDGGGWAKAS